jgi:hypothetical protein
MKKQIFLSLAVAALFTACNNNTEPATQQAPDVNVQVEQPKEVVREVEVVKEDNTQGVKVDKDGDVKVNIGGTEVEVEKKNP